MIDIFLGAKQYLQREGLLNEAGNYLKPFGRRPMVLGDELVFSIIRPTLEDRLKSAGLSPSFVLFGEECSRSEIARLVEIVKKENLDFIVGTGGGKALDTSRMVAEQLKLPLITLPTSAATCSAASAVAVVYEKGIRHVQPGEGSLYTPLLREIVRFFQTGIIPVSQEETVAMFAFMDAAQKSKEEGGKEIALLEN